jgi:hypothetical protein
MPRDPRHRRDGPLARLRQASSRILLDLLFAVFAVYSLFQPPRFVSSTTTGPLWNTLLFCEMFIGSFLVLLGIGIGRRYPQAIGMLVLLMSFLTLTVTGIAGNGFTSYDFLSAIMCVVVLDKLANLRARVRFERSMMAAADELHRHLKDSQDSPGPDGGPWTS